MEYIYITDNNLEKKQKYNYSQYGGEAFLNAYLANRKDAIDKLEEKNAIHQTYTELKKIKTQLSIVRTVDQILKNDIDAYVKTFEVRKRLYTGYDQNWKPTNEDYHDYMNYIIFAQVLVTMYEITDNVKYLSCLMKLDDTLISLIPLIPYSIRIEIKSILEAEIAGYEHCKSNMEEE